MEKTDKFIIAFVALIIIAIAVIIYIKIDKGYYTYEGWNGEEFIIDPQEIGNVTFYNVHTIANGKTYVLPLRNSPESVEEIHLEKDIIDKLNRDFGIDMLYVTKDPEINSKTENKATLGAIEFIRVLGSNEYGIYKINTKSAVTKEHMELPVATCDNVTEFVSVIQLQLGEENRIYSKDKCVIIEGKDGDGLLKASSKFAYHLMGVM